MGVFDQLFKGTKASRWINHRNLYLLGLATMLCGLGWSNALMSIGQFILLGNFILELDFYKRFRNLSTVFYLLISFYILHLLGLLWTSDFDYAFKDLRVKLPLLLLPTIIVASPKLEKKELMGLLYIYLATLIVLTFISLSKFFQLSNEINYDKRNLSIFISHIRYGLNLAFAALVSLHLAFKYSKKWLYIVFIWFSILLIIFEFYTGLICLLIASFCLIISSKSINKQFKVVSIFSLLAVCVFTWMFVKGVYEEYKKPEPLSYNQDLPKEKTINGNNYKHDFENSRQTNGVYLFRYFSYYELKKAWEKESNINWGEKDHKGQPIDFTLIRYLSSKGLTKDSLGFSKLSDKEIKAIESGVANYRYLTLNPIELRLHKTFYELEVYFSSGYANGFSLAMRLEYWKTAWHIIQDNFWIGVGTGDVKQAFVEQYQIDQSRLSEDYRRRTHNQYLTICLTFGLIGLLLFLAYLTYPILSYQGEWKFLLTAFWLIAILSFFTEDTLETQAGVTFFATFYSLFLLGVKKD